jgi:type I restriction enzyme S subunit
VLTGEIAVPDVAATSRWKTITLAECCEEVGQRVENPSASGYGRFVGLEHLESGTTSLRRWGSTNDVTSAMKLFKAGDVIVARRNVYLRRAARADFDGVCSGDGIVLRASGKGCLPGLLPYLLNTDAFWDYVSSQADGTMSKRVTVKRLMAYEFALPPLDEQGQRCDVLEAISDLEERVLVLIKSLWVMREAWLEQEFSKLARRWPAKVASDLMERITVGIVVKPADLYVPPGEGVPALRSLNVLPDRVVMEDLVYISLEGHAAHQKSRLTPGDVVIVRTGRPGDAAMVPTDLGELNCIDLIICGLSREIAPPFLCAAINSRFGKRQFAAGTAGTAQKHFNVGAFKDFKVPVPPTDLQSRLIDKLNDFSQLATKAELRLEDLRRIRLDLMQKVFPT